MGEADQSGILRATLALNPQEAGNGTERTVTLPGGRPLSIHIAPGAYKGQEIRLTGQGDRLPDGTMGDLIITLDIVHARQNSLSGIIEEQDAATVISNLPAIPVKPPETVYQSQDQPVPYQMPSPSNPSYPVHNITAETPYRTPQPIISPYVPLSSHSNVPAPPTHYQPPPIPIVQQPPQPVIKAKSARTWIIMVVLLVVVLGSGGVIAFTTIYLPNKQKADSTATATNNTQVAQQQATSTITQQQNNQTATSVAINDATATAQFSIMGDYITATTGTPALDDKLTTAQGSGFSTGRNCQFKDQAYHIVSKEENIFTICTNEDESFNDFALKLQMTIVKGDAGGLIFHVDQEQKKYYFLRIDNTGNFLLYYYDDDNAGQRSTLISRSQTSHFYQEYGTANELGLLVKGHTYKFYFNNEYVTSFSDTEGRISSGHIGLLALNVGKETEVTYTNLQVWKVS